MVTGVVIGGFYFLCKVAGESIAGTGASGRNWHKLPRRKPPPQSQGFIQPRFTSHVKVSVRWLPAHLKQVSPRHFHARLVGQLQLRGPAPVAWPKPHAGGTERTGHWAWTVFPPHGTCALEVYWNFSHFIHMQFLKQQMHRCVRSAGGWGRPCRP